LGQNSIRLPVEVSDTVVGKTLYNKEYTKPIDTGVRSERYSSLRRHWLDASGPHVAEDPPLEIGSKALIIYNYLYNLYTS